MESVERLLLETLNRKKCLTEQLKDCVDREAKVAKVLDTLDGRIGEIARETRAFENRIRSIKADSNICLDISPDLTSGCVMVLCC